MTKAPKIEDITKWFSIAIYTDSLRKHKIYSPSGFKTIYCDAKDIWSCRTQMMKYINAHLSDFVSSEDEKIMTAIRKGWFGKIYSSPVRIDGK